MNCCYPFHCPQSLRWLRLAILPLLLCTGRGLSAQAQRPAPVLRSAQSIAPEPAYRGLWVDAFHEGFKTPEQMFTLIRHMRTNKLNALFIEVRKTGDAYYRSRFEPAAKDMAPGYDPLSHAIALCHDTSKGQSRIEVHAWIVTYKISTKDAKLPADHVLMKYPYMVCKDNRGRTDLGGIVFLDPGAPGVIDHTASVAQDIARRYDVDGIHLDYVRYPDQQWGYNPYALARFRAQYQTKRQPSPDDPEWSQFRRDQVTALVRRVYAAVKTVKPRVKVSVAGITYGSPRYGFENASPYKQVFQDWVGWLKEGCVDIVCLMNYKREFKTDQRRDYRDWITFAGKAAAGRHIAIGQGSWFQSAAESIRQIQIAAADTSTNGYLVYSYAQPAKSSREYNGFWRSLASSINRYPAPLPAADWIDTPQTGIMVGRVLLDGATTPRAGDGVKVHLLGPTRRTVQADCSGFYVATNLGAGRYQVFSVDHAGKRQGGATVLQAGKLARVDIKIPATVPAAP